MTTRTLAVALALTALTVAPSAFAADTHSEKETKEGWVYKFQDDDLLASGIGSKVPMIRVRSGAARATLIRPRTSFVSELLSSTENL